MSIRIELEDGKYVYEQDDKGSRALRYGEPWQDLTGNKFVGAMAWEIERLREALTAAAAHLTGAASAYRKHASRHRSKGRAAADPFFSTRASDFEKAANEACVALKKQLV